MILIFIKTKSCAYKCSQIFWLLIRSFTFCIFFFQWSYWDRESSFESKAKNKEEVGRLWFRCEFTGFLEQRCLLSTSSNLLRILCQAPAADYIRCIQNYVNKILYFLRTLPPPPPKSNLKIGHFCDVILHTHVILYWHLINNYTHSSMDHFLIFVKCLIFKDEKQNQLLCHTSITIYHGFVDIFIVP